MSNLQTETKSKKPSKAQIAKAKKMFGNALTESEMQEELEMLESEIAPRNKSFDAMQFAVQQLSAPVAPQLVTPDAAIQSYNEAHKALKAQFGITTKATRVKIEQNGVSRPGPDNLCGKIWAALDTMDEATIKNLMHHFDSLKLDINIHTMKTQFARWRSFNGITKQPKQPKQL